jgi:hypothetical protein
MDRNIEQQVLSGKKRKTTLYVLLGVILMVAFIFVIRYSLGSTHQQ